MAVEAGDWLPGRRRVFIHPSAIAPLQISPKPALPMMSSPATLQLTVNLARAQIEAGPHTHEDEPVTRDMEGLLYDYYGWDPYWGASYFGGSVLANANLRSCQTRRGATRTRRSPLDGGDHLHSVAEFKGYAVHAVDGDIGHVENLLADDADWDVRYLVIATRNWWPGKVVQLSPHAVKDIDWFGEHIDMNVNRNRCGLRRPGTRWQWPTRSARMRSIAISAGRATAGYQEAEPPWGLERRVPLLPRAFGKNAGLSTSDATRVGAGMRAGCVIA